MEGRREEEAEDTRKWRGNGSKEQEERLRITGMSEDRAYLFYYLLKGDMKGGRERRRGGR